MTLHNPSQALDQKNLFFFEEKLLPLADDLYRYAYFVWGDQAFDHVKQTFESVSQNGLTEELSANPLLLEFLIQEMNEVAKEATPSKSLDFAADLEVDERQILYLADVLEFSLSTIQDLCEKDESEVFLALTQAKKRKIALDKTANEEDLQFFIKNHNFFLIDELTGESLKKFLRLLQVEHFKQVFDELSLLRGKLQNQVKNLFLSPTQKNELNAIVEDPELKKTREISQIESYMRHEKKRDRYRLASFFVVLGLLFGIAVYQLSQFQRERISLIESLSYEASAFLSEGTDRIDMDVATFAEIKNFVGQSGVPLNVSIPSGGLDPVGISKIDYTTRQIIAIKFVDSMQNPYIYFATKASLDDLTLSEPGKIGDQIFYAFEGDTFNMIAWENESTLYFLAGYESALDLANFLSAR